MKGRVSAQSSSPEYHTSKTFSGFCWRLTLTTGHLDPEFMQKLGMPQCYTCGKTRPHAAPGFPVSGGWQQSFMERKWVLSSPEGPSTQIVRFLGPKIHTLSGFLDLETLLFGNLDP